VNAASMAEGVSELVLSGPLLVALLIALVAGALSFFSPCCLPLVPGYLSYVAGTVGAQVHTDTAGAAPAAAGTREVVHEERGTITAVGRQLAVQTSANEPSPRHRTLAGASLFVVGFAAVFTSYGALFGGLGSLLLLHQDAVVRVFGIVTIVLGLLFTGALARLPLANASVRLSYRPRAGLAGAPLLGVLFGVGWTPCIGPTLAAVLTLATSTADAGRGALLSFAYSLGLGVPFLVAAVSFEKAMRVFGFARRHARAVMRTGGVMLIVLGLLQVTGLWTTLMTLLQGLILGYQLPL
jgi:cytochrome c-type biogenesis protein